jgi:hypothetical protein
MRSANFFAVLALTLSASSIFCHAQIKNQEAWPQSAAPGKIVTLNAANLPAYIPAINIPDGCKVVLYVVSIGNRVSSHSYEISTGKFTFGKGAIISLAASSFPVVPGAPSIDHANDKQPGYGQKGASGTPGQPGTPGNPGLSLTMHIGSLGHSGSLWITTSGQPGSAGGNGGSGGLGGGMKKGFWDRSNGGDGGDAGAGGKGGDGGATSKVTLVMADGLTVSHATFRNIPVAGPFPNNRPDGPVAPPAGFGDDSGAIFIYGAPGKGGNKGLAGNPGQGGDEGQEYHIDGAPGGVFLHGGQRGRSASDGTPGKDGDRTE